VGTARRTLDEMTALASRTVRFPGGAALSERAVFHAELGRAETKVRAARVAHRAAISDALAAARASGSTPESVHIAVAAASVYAVETCTEVITDLFRYGGGRVLSLSSPVQRYLRDALAVRQHIGVSEENYERAGRHRIESWRSRSPSFSGEPRGDGGREAPYARGGPGGSSPPGVTELQEAQVLSGLASKVAIGTGGAGGLGSAAARRLSEEGCRVVVVDRDGEGARKVAEELPGESAWVRADVARGEDVEEYLGVATSTFGRIDLHHLNAGIPGSPGGFPDLEAAEFDRVMAVNVRGVFLGLRGAFRGYREQGITGNVVLTASIASLRGSADLIAYQTSKHAVLGLLRGAAMYGGPPGVRGKAVAPGIGPRDPVAAA